MARRLTLLAVAILALAWLAILWRDQRIVDDVSPEIGSPSLSATQFESDARRLEDAGLLNPDPSWRIIRGLALIRHDRPRAIRDLSHVVASEPDNLTAWRLLYVAAHESDQPLAARARAQIKRLDPLAQRHAG